MSSLCRLDNQALLDYLRKNTDRYRVIYLWRDEQPLGRKCHSLWLVPTKQELGVVESAPTLPIVAVYCLAEKAKGGLKVISNWTEYQYPCEGEEENA